MTTFRSSCAMPAARRLTRGMPDLPASAAAATRLAGGHPEGFIEAFAHLYLEFAADVRSQQQGLAVLASPVPGLEDGICSLAFIEAALHSHAHNAAWTPLPA